MRSGRPQKEQRKTRSIGSCLAALACLLLLAIPISFAPAANAVPVGKHRAARAAIERKARKKKKPVPPTIKLKLLGSVAPETPENGNARHGWLYTDGVRWAAYEPTAGTTRLIETIKNKTVERPDPEGCADGLIAVGGGEMLYSCEDPECPEHERSCPLPSNHDLASTRYVIEDIGSGEQHPVAGEDTLPNQSPEAGIGNLAQIGSQWAEGGIGTHIGGYNFFLDWHTGQLVREEQQGSEQSIENLSNPNLTQRLCKPITRPENTNEYKFSDYSPLAYEPPFAVVGPLGEPELKVYVPLQLRKCGSSKRVLLPPGNGVQLGGRVVSWVGKGPYVTQLHTSESAWHGPYYKLTGLPSEVGAKISFVQHTSNTVFVTIKSGPGSAQVYLARLPWTKSAR
ncbi:MAG: hypothetical protein WAU69_05640 [Solirubrobacteraceae bacterium]